MEESVNNEIKQERPGQKSDAPLKLEVSSVPATISEDYYNPNGTSIPGMLLTVVLIGTALLILRRGRTLRRCTLFLCLSCALILLAIAGMLWGWQGEANALASYPSQLSDFCGILFFTIRSHLWMFFVSVVTIPIGIYWTVLAHANKK